MSELQPEALILKSLLKSSKMKETHISYVFLTDEYVYKLKKPVDFGFLDFRLKKYRRNYCLIEKDLNSRFSKDIYLEVLKIAKQGKEFVFRPYDSTLLTVDYVLKMKRIPDKDFLSAHIEKNLISLEQAEIIGSKIAEKLKNIETPIEKAIENGSFDIIKQNCIENFDQTEALVGSLMDQKYFNFIKSQTMAFLDTNKSLLINRVQNGFIKDGHGDLRLEHVYFGTENEIGLIDCIEFNKRFRFSDVVSDFVFLCMELDQMGKYEISDAMLKGFLTIFNDKDTLKLINFYKCYRAYIRAKVSSFLLSEKGEEWDGYSEKKAEFDNLINMSLIYALNMSETKPVIFYGMMASGKSKNGKAFAAKYPVAYVNTDIVRKELTGIVPETKVYVEYNHDIYSPEVTEQVYKQMGVKALEKASIGRMIIVDGSFSKLASLTQFQEKYSIPTTKIRFYAPNDIIMQRLEKRKTKSTITDGRPEIYEQQKQSFEDIGSNMEIETTATVDSNLIKIMDFLIK